jgi:RNA polymerase sigma-70 factor (ECF subfamily)
MSVTIAEKPVIYAPPEPPAELLEPNTAPSEVSTAPNSTEANLAKDTQGARQRAERIIDQELFDRVRGGDTEAFGQLFARHAPSLIRLAVSKGADPHAAEDLVQGTAELAFKGRDKFDGTNFRAWSYRILTNLSINQYRACQRKPETMGEARDITFEKTSSSENVVKEIETQDTVDYLLNQLDPDKRDVIKLIYLEDLTYRQAAGRLGIELGTLQSRYGRAMAQLREFVQANPDLI